MRTTLLGSLLDVARHNRARGAERRAAVRVRRGLPARASPADGDAARPRRPRSPASTALPDERQHLGAAARRPPAAADLARARAAAGRTSSPPRACSRALLDALRVPWTVEPAREPFLHPGRAARVLAGGEPAGWLGELHPAVAAALGPRAGRRLRARPRRARATPPAPCRDYDDLTSFPAVRQDLAVVVADDVPAARGASTSCATPAARCSPRRGLRRLPRRAGGRGPASLALRLEFRAPDRTLTDEEAAERRERIVAALAEQLEASCVADGARPRRVRLRRRARRARCCTATRTSSCAASPRARTPGGASTTLYPRTASRWRSRSSTSTSTATSTPRSSPTRTAPRRRGGRAARARRAGRRPVGRLPPARPRDLRALVRRARRAGAVRRRRLRAARALPRRDRGRRPRRQPRLLPDRRAARRSRRSRAPG